MVGVLLNILLVDASATRVIMERLVISCSVSIIAPILMEFASLMMEPVIVDGYLILMKI